MKTLIDDYLDQIYWWWESCMADVVGNQTRFFMTQLSETIENIENSIKEQDPDGKKQEQLEDLSTFDTDEEINAFLSSITTLISLLSVKHYAELVFEQMEQYRIS